MLTMVNGPTPALDSSREAARETVRVMMQVTRWSASKLATKSGLAASTLNRFMNKDVKHTLKFSTLSRLLVTALARLNERLLTAPRVADADVEAVIPLISQFGIDLEREAERVGQEAGGDPFWNLDTVVERIVAVTRDEAWRAAATDASFAAAGFADSEAVIVRGYDLPVLGAAMGGDNSLFFDNGAIHERIRRPPNLDGVQNAFAIYMVGDSMEPRYFAGEFLFVNPNRPPARNCFVVVELGDGQGMVKQFIKRDDTILHLRQFNPDKDLEIENEKVRSVYRIVGTGEP